MKHLVLALSASFALSACGGRPAAESPAPGGGGPAMGAPPMSPSPGTTASPAGEPGREYDIRGTVTDVAADRRSVTLDHEEIPGLMAAMKMEYKVSRPEVLSGLAKGDRVRGRLQVKGTDYLIVSLAKR